MFWYVIICILMLYPLGIVYGGYVSEKKTQQVALLASCFILWFFMAMRSTVVGVDTKYYAYIFQQFSDIPFNKIFTAETFATHTQTWSLDFEYGYRLYNKFISFFTDNPQAITICNSTMIIVLLYYCIKRNSKNCLLSIWLYITLGIYQTEMNVTRNAIAILIVYNAFLFLKTKRVVPYVICCLIAASFHKTTLIFIPLYWVIDNIKWTQKRMITVFLSAICMGIGFALIMPAVRNALPSAVTKYFFSSNSKAEAVMVGAFNLFLFAVIYFLMNKKEQTKVLTECNVGLTMFMLNLCFFGLSTGIGYGARIAALFGPYMILFIPEMLSIIESKNKRTMVMWILAGVCGCQYFLRLCINNIGGTMPYSFFW